MANLKRVPEKKKILKLLIDLELTQTELAKRAQLSRIYVVHLINGTHLVTKESSGPERIAKALGASVDELFPLRDISRTASAA
jgi:transcriptional regulator with XRE-family HTH domain